MWVPGPCPGPRLWDPGKGRPQEARDPAEAVRLKVAGAHPDQDKYWMVSLTCGTKKDKKSDS